MQVPFYQVRLTSEYFVSLQPTLTTNLPLGALKNMTPACEMDTCDGGAIIKI